MSDSLTSLKVNPDGKTGATPQGMKKKADLVQPHKKVPYSLLVN